MTSQRSRLSYAAARQVRTATRWRTATLVATVLAFAVVGCGAAPPPVGAVPSPDVPLPEASIKPAPTNTPIAFKLDVFIDAKTVTPLRKAVVLIRGHTVLLVFHSDHDVQVTISGAGLDQTVFVARLATIPVSFVVDQRGVVTIESADPVATIAELTVI